MNTPVIIYPFSSISIKTDLDEYEIQIMKCAFENISFDNINYPLTISILSSNTLLLSSKLARVFMDQIMIKNIKTSQIYASIYADV